MLYESPNTTLENCRLKYGKSQKASSEKHGDHQDQRTSKKDLGISDKHRSNFRFRVRFRFRLVRTQLNWT